LQEGTAIAETIVYVDHSEIRTGKLAEVRSSIKELVDFVEANEPWPFSYSIFVSEDTSTMTVVQVQPDSASLERHIEIAGPAFRKFLGLINLVRIDVYGEPSDRLRELLKQKATMLGSGTVEFHELQAGFSRFEPRMEQASPSAS
jgi:hypothetical protein